MGQPAYGASFFGRSSILDRLVGRTAPSLTIMGNRRIDKTSLVRVATAAAVIAALRESSRREVFAPEVDDTDCGIGMVRTPA